MDFRTLIEESAWDERFLRWTDRHPWGCVGYIALAIILLDLLTRIV